MPHIDVVFQKPSNTVLEIFEREKDEIRAVVGSVLDYLPEAVVIIPRILSRVETKLASNMLPIAFVIDMGSRTNANQANTDGIRDALVRHVNGMEMMHFGIWLRNAGGKYSEHNPRS